MPLIEAAMGTVKVSDQSMVWAEGLKGCWDESAGGNKVIGSEILLS